MKDKLEGRRVKERQEEFRGLRKRVQLAGVAYLPLGFSKLIGRGGGPKEISKISEKKIENYFTMFEIVATLL